MWDIAIKSGFGVRPRPGVPVDAKTPRSLKTSPSYMTPRSLKTSPSYMTPPSHKEGTPEQYADHDEPLVTFTATENASLAALLEPVHDQLLQLRKTTPDGYPDYQRGVRNNHILGHDYGEALCERIAGIGEHIKRHLAEIPETFRGRMELNLCHYIASEYWPLPGKWGTHLTIMAMYTNTLARQIPLQLYASAEAGWQKWTREREDRRRAGLGVWTLENELARFGTKQAWDKQPAFSGSSYTGWDDNFLQNNQEDAQVALLLATQEREEQEAQDRDLAARIQAEDDAVGAESRPSNHALDDKAIHVNNPDAANQYDGGEDKPARNWDDTQLVDVDSPPSVLSIGSSLSSDAMQATKYGALHESESYDQPQTMSFLRDPVQVEQDDVEFAINQSLRDQTYSLLDSIATLTISDTSSPRAHFKDALPDQAEVKRMSHGSTRAMQSEQVDSQPAVEASQHECPETIREPIDPLLEQSSYFPAQPPSSPERTHPSSAQSHRYGNDPQPFKPSTSHKRYKKAKAKTRRDHMN